MTITRKIFSGWEVDDSSELQELIIKELKKIPAYNLKGYSSKWLERYEERPSFDSENLCIFYKDGVPVCAITDYMEPEDCTLHRDLSEFLDLFEIGYELGKEK